MAPRAGGWTHRRTSRCPRTAPDSSAACPRSTEPTGSPRSAWPAWPGPDRTQARALCGPRGFRVRSHHEDRAEHPVTRAIAALGEAIARVEAAGADQLHVDVMDGHFVPNLTIGPPVIESIRKRTRLPLDVHLMIEEPERWVETYVKAGADYLTLHVDACPHLPPALSLIPGACARDGRCPQPPAPP